MIFPQDKQGTIEPLVVTGRDFLTDYLFVHYLGRDIVRFGLEHTSRGSLVGVPVSDQSRARCRPCASTWARSIRRRPIPILTP